jgi:hypothetical protein
MSRLGLGEPGGTIPPYQPSLTSPRAMAGSLGSRWFPLRFNQWMGVRFAAGCWVQGAPSQSSGHLALFVYDVFWLLSFGF